MPSVSIVVDTGTGRECSIVENSISVRGGYSRDNSDCTVEVLLAAAVAAMRRALDLPDNPERPRPGDADHH